MNVFMNYYEQTAFSSLRKSCSKSLINCWSRVKPFHKFQRPLSFSLPYECFSNTTVDSGSVQSLCLLGTFHWQAKDITGNGSSSDATGALPAE